MEEKSFRSSSFPSLHTYIHTFQLFIDGCQFSIADFQGTVYLQRRKAKNVQNREKNDLS